MPFELGEVISLDSLGFSSIGHKVPIQIDQFKGQ